jgi:hypothetical protein
VPLPEGERAAAREVFLAKYPSAFYVDFGDFRWFRVEGLKGGRFIGGFGRVASVRMLCAAGPLPQGSFACAAGRLPQGSFAVSAASGMLNGLSSPACPFPPRGCCLLRALPLLQVTAEDYLAASPDPVASFAPHVAGHMNGEDSHVQDMRDMVQHYVGLGVTSARMLDLDRLGINMEVERAGETFKLRLPFIRCVWGGGVVLQHTSRHQHHHRDAPPSQPA